MDAVDWLNQQFERTKKSQRGLAKALNVDPSAVSRMVHGQRQLRLDEVERAAGYFGVEMPADLHLPVAVTPDVPPAYAGPLEAGYFPIGREDFAAIPRYDARLSAGDGAIIDPDAEPLGYHLFEAQWLRMVTQAAPQDLAVMRVDSDSMEPTFSDGDWVLIDRTQSRFGREGVYALQVGESTWIKRLSLNLRNKRVRVLSDNKKYDPNEYEEGDVTLLGRVVMVVARRV